MTTKKVDKLTSDQEAQVAVYLDKWLKIGRRTKSLDTHKTIEAVKTIYRCAKMEEPKHFFLFPSPLQCQLAVAVMRDKRFQDELIKINLEESTLGSNLRSNLGSNLGSNLRSNLGSNLESNLGSNLWSNLGSNLESNLRSNLETRYESTFYGYYWFGWTAFYDFVLNVIFEEKIAEHQDFVAFTAAMKEVHLFIPFKDIVFICNTPSSLTIDAVGRLHGEILPSMMYEDGYSLFYMNGVQVPKWAVETPKDDIQPKQVLELTNTEQRMALMKHVGLSRFLTDLGAEAIDKENDYVLYYLNVEGQKIGPYLYMACPSSGREFLEGCGDATKYDNIDPTINTCQQALEWRMKRASKNFMTKFNVKSNWRYDA